jgi:crotonobetainyl-CoA:carnitine CoA-transferase CaiB-like acyl-CoA transferase
VLVDLRSKRSREVFKKLLAEVDIVTLNATDQQRDKLGLVKSLAILTP